MFKVKTTLCFNDIDGDTIAHVDVAINLSPNGPTIVNEYSLDSKSNKYHYMSAKNECLCPEVSDLQLPCKKSKNEDEDDWEVMCAEYGNGQKMFIKYKRGTYTNSQVRYDEPCEQPVVKATKSDEKLNKYLFGLINQMHTMLATTGRKK